MSVRNMFAVARLYRDEDNSDRGALARALLDAEELIREFLEGEATSALIVTGKRGCDCQTCAKARQLLAVSSPTIEAQ